MRPSPCLRPSLPRHDAVALLVSLLLGGGMGFLITRVPAIYTLAWWIGAPCATLAACQCVRRASLLFPVTATTNLAVLIVFWLSGGVPKVMLRIYHTSRLEGKALRGFGSDLLSTALLACFASCIVAFVVRNGRLVERTRE